VANQTHIRMNAYAYQQLFWRRPKFQNYPIPILLTQVLR
jgi:hypothetical protein